MKKRLILTALLLFCSSLNYLGCSSKSPTDTVAPDLTKLDVSSFVQTYSVPYNKSFTLQTIFRITSTGDEVLDYTMSNNSNWLKLNNFSGTLVGSTDDSAFFSFQVTSPELLEQGTYYDTITISTSSQARNTIQREMILHIGSEIIAEPENFEFLANVGGGTLATQELDVHSSSSVNFDVTFTKTASWLQIPTSTYNTSNSNNIPVSVDLTGLQSGDYIDTIWIHSDSAFNSPHPVEVHLNVQGWLAQKSPRTVSHNINDVFFVDELNGWAVGDLIDANSKSGFIFNTTDGGLNWEENRFLSATTFSDSILAGITFVGNEGWVAGANNIIMHTNNYGVDWTFQSLPSNMPTDTTNFKDIFFISADSGWIVGDTGVILATSDGGISWNLQPTPTTKVLTGISFTDNLHGWVSGLRDVILTTDDGGQTWTQQTIPNNDATTDKYDFNEIMFVDNSTGWAVGKFGLIISTVDGGTTWTVKQLAMDPVSNRLTSLFFINATTGWVSGQSGEILKTTDGGANWVEQSSGSVSTLNSIYFLDENNGWIAGGDGTILRTYSGGN